MPKRSYNLSDENYVKLMRIAKENGVDMVDIVNLCIAQYDENQELKKTLTATKIAARNCEKLLNILYAAQNNFYLNFAANMTEYVRPYVSEHPWLKQAAQDEETRIQMKSHDKKWAGGNPKPPDEKR